MWIERIFQQRTAGCALKYLMPFALIMLPVSQSAFSASGQICKTESIPAATPSSEFAADGDGTALHKPTGLIWMRCALGQQWDGKTCIGTVSKLSWQQALQMAAEFNQAGGYAGHQDWRLPNIKELDSIVETQCFFPAVNLDIFPATPSKRFWSSSLDIRHPYPRSYAWFIQFEQGYVDDANNRREYRVRLVRSGNSPAGFDRKAK